MKGHLSEVGYDSDQHDQKINALKNKGLSITESIEAVVIIYQALYQQDAYEINCGNCEEFAHDVISVFTGGNGWINETDDLCATWHDEQPDCSEDEKYCWSHKFICYKDKYYDSQSPEGVENWRELSCFSE